MDRRTKAELIKIAEHFELVLGHKKSKDSLNANVKTALVKMGVLEVKELASMVECTGDPPPAFGDSAVLSFEQQRELVMLHMKLEQKKVAGSRKGVPKC